MKEMIEIIARAIVDEPELVTVIEVGGMHASTPELTVAKEDIGSSVSSAVKPTRYGIY